MKTKPIVLALTVVFAALAVANLAAPPASKVDFGAWGVVVLQSDDWGFEASFPNEVAAQALKDLTTELGPGMQAYATTSLEQAADIDSLATFLAGFIDADGLPAVLQANTVVAGLDLLRPGADNWSLHESGMGEGPYFRPSLGFAVDRAIERGVWWPELHGLTHFDLERYRAAYENKDPWALAAHEYGVLAYKGWLLDAELSGTDPQHAVDIAQESVLRFERRFGRRPSSVIAPRYRWGAEDEDAWEALGITVVQAKREQVDPTLNPGSTVGRVRKWLRRWWDTRSRGLVYLERHARLEPYGESDPACGQCAFAAVDAVRAAWREGKPGIISSHRVQFVNFDSRVVKAGREQLATALRLLADDRPTRYLLDIEVAQLKRSGYSVIHRGQSWIVRNYSPRDRVIQLTPDLPPRLYSPGTHVVEAPESNRGPS